MASCIYFIAGSAPTAPEQAKIDYLNLHCAETVVRTRLARSLSYSGLVEASDYVAGLVPTEYAAVP